MKGVVFLGDRKLELREFPDPTPGPRDVVLEIKASGMCGSDLHNYRAPAHAPGTVTGGITRQAGMIAGHEPCGIVAAVGAGVTDKEARVGQRVMDHHYDGCGTCKHCRAGWTQMCLAGTVVELGKAGLERHEAAGRDEFAHPVHDRQPMLRRELDDALPVGNQHEIAHHDQAVEALPPG